MYTKLHALLVIIFLVGCESEPTPPTSDDQIEIPRFQVGVGDQEDFEPPHLSFTITAMHEKQKPSEEAPFHEDGGDWTFLECQAEKDAEVILTVGVKSKKTSGDVPIAWGEAILIVEDKEAGGTFLSLFGKSFPGKSPSPSDQQYEPKPLRIDTAVLGQGLHREPQGGFSGKAGGWTATKWFPEFDGRSGEIFFNYNLAKRKGEFSEKDAEYADSLLALFAAALRDGPRPERTPENDPNLTLIGPSIGPARKLLSKRASYHAISPNDKFAIYQVGATVFALSLDEPKGEPFEIIRFDHSPWELRVLNDDLDLLVQEGIPENPAFRSSGDPMRIWWVDGKNKKRTLLREPEKDLNLAEAPVSPDLRYVGLGQYKGKPGTDGRCKVLFILDRTDGTEKKFRLDGKDLFLVGWKTTDVSVQAIVVTNRWQFDGEESELYLADLATGTLEHQKGVDARYDLDNLLSPDGKHRVRVGENDLIVTDVASGEQRQFVFHEDDLEFIGEECVEWVSPQYLKFNGQRLSLIDVTTMKMCFPTSSDEIQTASHTYKFSSELRWVLFEGDDAQGPALYLAPVELPKQEQ